MIENGWIENRAEAKNESTNKRQVELGCNLISGLSNATRQLHRENGTEERMEPH